MTDVETRTLGDELDRLDAEAADLAARLDDVDSGTMSASLIKSMANTVEQSGGAVAYLIDEFGVDAPVTVRGLTAGQQARVKDRIAAERERGNHDGGLPGTRRNLFAAAGLVDAPFFERPTDDAGEPLDPDDRQHFQAAVATVADQPPGVAVWLRELVNDKSTLSGNSWTPLSERLRGDSTN